MAGTRNDLSVLIVGAGPVGMTLASELARYGVTVRIVDKAPQRTDKSKALVLWSRTLELLDRGMGARPFVEAGFKVHGVSIQAGGATIGRLEMDAVPSPYPFALMIPQSETERLLEERLAEQGVTVERSVAAQSIDVGSEGVSAVLQAASGHEETVRARWLVGCDGAHSVVRHALGVPFSGETLPSDWMLADVHMTGYPHPDTDAAVYWHKEGVLIVFPISPGRYRVLGDLPSSGAEVPPAPTLDQVRDLLARRASPGMSVHDPIWLAGFRINDRKVRDYRHGRVFLAGDAAHIHSPAGGQGMNTGMQDAFNIAWKLALVEQGTCGEALLDSYSPERSAVGDQVLEAAGRLTTIATLKNPVAQQVRNLVGHLVLGVTAARHKVADTLSEVAVHYPDSPLNGPSLRRGPRPGERLAPAKGDTPIGSGNAPRFVLLAERTSAIDDLVARRPGLVDPAVRPPLRDGAIWLIRPDGYVACASEDPREIADYLDRIAAEPAHQVGAVPRRHGEADGPRH
ncbi:FAD-dependent monooxygenase [Antarcticirhabdus aurantiaca]|uniref:FAD-dependent monooxygenase n=1 Tax=Antarcticirhabdus aurantiaca TaxID=2606717 RepID=A0ACD4NXG1_9HYPH|nr:FAD-dependent monooxygenase [Antarcticirhabdus aurantiaca]WAJ31466.1 FAD-dependent monooxygenase [Jeongeuplla avenae]